MSESSSKTGRWVAAGLAVIGLAAAFFNMLADNMPKGEAAKIEGYVPWSEETIRIAETIPVQNGGRIKPFSSYAGFTMLSLHGARSMKVEGEKQDLSFFKKFVIRLRGGNPDVHKIKPTEWMLDTLFRPHLATKLPTFRIDNSAVLEAIGVKAKGRRDRYSYEDLEPARSQLIELAKTYEGIEEKQRDPVQQQTIHLAYSMMSYESLLGYFGFARFGVVLTGSGGGTQPDRQVEMSALMSMAPHLRSELAKAQGEGKSISPHLRGLLQQIEQASTLSKFGLVVLPPADKSDLIWKSAGIVMTDVMAGQSPDPELAVADIKMMEKTARSIGSGEEAFRGELAAMRDALAKRAEDRGEYRAIELEAEYYRKDWFLKAMVFFLIGTLSGLAMWAVRKGRAEKILSWITLGTTALGLIYCTIAIVKRCVIMWRPPVGNLYDTIVFIAATVVLLALVVEWMTKRRFALGFAPILGLLLIILARRYELGDAKDHMNPLVAVLDSNYWLTVHVITITLGYSAGLLSAFLSCGYLLLRGLRLDGGDKELRRSATRIVYGCICLTLFLSLIGTVLGGIWANYSWGRFWGWDPKENGALMIVIWTLAILHARLGGYIKEWGLHLASVFTACIVAFSWWHVNFLGVGLHNYGFTAGKNTIWAFYSVMGVFLGFGVIAMVLENHRKAGKKAAVTGNGGEDEAIGAEG